MMGKNGYHGIGNDCDVVVVIQGGGVLVNNRKIEDELYVVQASDLIGDRLMLVAAGKKNKMLIRVEE
jgi:tyrosyl-tRNA synthetase